MGVGFSSYQGAVVIHLAVPNKPSLQSHGKVMGMADILSEHFAMWIPPIGKGSILEASAKHLLLRAFAGTPVRWSIDAEIEDCAEAGKSESRCRMHVAQYRAYALILQLDHGLEPTLLINL